MNKNILLDLQKMKQFATELEQSSQKQQTTTNAANLTMPSTSQLPVAPLKKELPNLIKEKKRPMAAKITVKQQQCTGQRPSTSSATCTTTTEVKCSKEAKKESKKRPKSSPANSGTTGTAGELDGWQIRFSDLEVNLFIHGKKSLKYK